MRHPKTVLLALSLALVTFGTAATSFASGDADDVVLLKNGGRMRGTVVSEEPSTGVRIKLPNGTLRTVKTEDVVEVRYAGKAAHVEAPEGPPPAAPAAPPAAPAPPPEPAHGKLHVEASAPASVQLDGALVGPAPVDVDFLKIGKHRVRVTFDDGGSREEAVLVQADRTFPLHVDPPTVRALQIEVLGFASYGLAPSGGSPVNPFGGGIGVRAGLLISRVYLGIEYAHYFGQTSIAQDVSVSGTADTVAAQVGYDIHLGSSPVVLRPYLGIGAAFVRATATSSGASLSDSNSETAVLASTGLYSRVMLSKMLFVAADARLNLAVNEDSATEASFFAGGGALFL